jgi:dihydroneopterin aldolase
MDTVSLQGIDVFAYHGVLPEERKLGQRFIVDVDLWADCTAAALSDDLAQALDYSVAHQLVCDTTTGSSYQLIEALAGELCRVLLQNMPVEKVLVRVHKPQAPIPDFLGQATVTLTRDRSWLKTTFGGGS